MKKVLITIMAVFYLGVSSGATVHFHYCMGELINWGLAQQKDPNCSNCGMEKGDSEKCCKDEHKQLKIDKAQKATESNLLIKQFPVSALKHQTFQLKAVFVPTEQEEHPLSNSPPRTEKTPTFLRNCTFRI